MTPPKFLRHPRWPAGAEILLWSVLLAQLLWVALPLLGAARATPLAPTSAGGGVPLLAGHDPFATDGAPSADADVAGLRLFGIRLSSRGNAAILGAGAGTQRAHRAGDEIAPGVTLETIESDHVTLRHAGQPRRLELPAVAAPPPAAATVVAAPPATATATATAKPVTPPVAETHADVDPGRLIAQAGLRMVADAGRGAGYTVLPRGNDALMRAAGLQPGDVLVSVNGQALDAERLAELAIQLKTNPHAEIAYRRDGQMRTVTLGTGKP